MAGHAQEVVFLLRGDALRRDILEERDVRDSRARGGIIYGA